MTAPKLNSKPDAQEIARLFAESVMSPVMTSQMQLAEVLADASPELRHRLAAAIYPEGVPAPFTFLGDDGDDD